MLGCQTQPRHFVEIGHLGLQLALDTARPDWQSVIIADLNKGSFSFSPKLISWLVYLVGLAFAEVPWEQDFKKQAQVPTEQNEPKGH